MRSEKQLKASRANGAKSRGPVTAPGKRNSSLNSLRHGAFSHEIRLATESEAEFEAFAQSLRDEFQPQGFFESMLVDTIISAKWRAVRFSILAKALKDYEIRRKEKQLTS